MVTQRQRFELARGTFEKALVRLHEALQAATGPTERLAIEVAAFIRAEAVGAFDELRARLAAS